VNHPTPWIVALALLAPTPAWSQDDAVDLELHDMPVQAALDVVAVQVGQVLVADPGLEAQATLSLRATPWREAVAAIASATGCEVEQRQGWLRLHRPPRVSYACTDADVRVVLLELAERARRSLIVAPDVTGAVSLELDDVPYREAFARAAEAAELKVLELDGCTLISRKELSPLPRLTPALSLPDVPGLEARVNVDLSRHPLPAALAQLGVQVGVNLVADPYIDEAVSVRLRGVPAHAALQRLLRPGQCQVEQLAPNVLYVSQPPRLDLHYADASAELALLQASTYSGWPLVACPDVRDRRRLALHLEQLPIEVALRAIGTACGLRLQRAPDGVLTAGRRLPPARTPTHPPGSATRRFALELEDATLQDVVAALQERDPEARALVAAPNAELRLSLSLRAVTWHEALRTLQRTRRLRLDARDGALQLDGPDRRMLAFDQAPVPVALYLAARAAGCRVECPERVAGVISAELSWVSPRRALEHLAAACGLTLRETESGVLQVEWTDAAERQLGGRQPGPRSDPPPPPPTPEPKRIHEAFAATLRFRGELERFDARWRSTRLADLDRDSPEQRALHAEVSRIADDYVDCFAYESTNHAQAMLVDAFARWWPHATHDAPAVRTLAHYVVGQVLLLRADTLQWNDRFEAGLRVLEEIPPHVAALRDLPCGWRQSYMLENRYRQRLELLQRGLVISRFPIHVQALWWQGEEGENAAILNGQIVHVGNGFKCEGAEERVVLKEISPFSATLTYKGTHFVRLLRSF